MSLLSGSDRHVRGQQERLHSFTVGGTAAVPALPSTAPRLQAWPDRTRYGRRVTRIWRWAAVLAFPCAAACGGRFLSDDSRLSGCSDAGRGAAEDGGASQGGRTGAPRDGGLDGSTGGFHFALEGGVPWDALPMPEAGPVSDCLACTRDNCGELIDSCAQNEACLVAAACVALRCTDPENPLCPRRCSEREPAATIASAMALACVIDQCQDSCDPRSLLGDASAADRPRLGESGAGG